jgi:sphingosine kinase
MASICNIEAYKMNKFLLIYNPHGGLKKGKHILKKIKPIFENAKKELTILESEYSGHAFDYANTLKFQGYHGLCVIGGDGTMHEVVNGMLTRSDKKQLPIGLIPGGTGNSFMHDLELMNPIDAVKAIIGGNTRQIDVAEVKINDMIKYAFNIIGWGLVTDVGNKAEKWRWLGEARYTLLSVFEVLKYKPRLATLILDNDEIIDNFTFIIGCNTMYTGKGMKMAPKAKLDDGLMDIVVVRHGHSRLKILTMLPKVYDGTHINSPILEYYQVSEFSLIPERDEILNIDGEVSGTTPIHVKMIPGAFQVFS